MKTWLTALGITALIALSLIFALVFIDWGQNPTSLVAPRECSPTDISEALEDTNLGNFSLNLSRQVFECSDEVVLAPISADFDVLLAASHLASTLESPLLIYELVDGDPFLDPFLDGAALFAEVARLEPRQVNFIGEAQMAEEFSMVLEDQGLDNIQIQQFDIAEMDLINAIDPSANEITKILALMEAGVPESQLEADLTPELKSVALASFANPGAPVWLLSQQDYILALPLLPTLAILDGSLLFLDSAEDIRTSTQIAKHLKTSSVEPQLISPQTETAKWQLDVIRFSDPLPSGKYLLFQDEQLVAFYGHLQNTGLGELGRYRTPAHALAGLDPFLEEYRSENVGTQITPAFEIIATVASVDPGRDENFSNETSISRMRPWVEAAADLGIYVILDLQPGREDFLTQAKLYQELLMYPNVGLGLDPEWRLLPHQFHLNQIGRVSAEEVNQVSDWLAALVRENNLPQKLLLIHQFRAFMVIHRANIIPTPELAILFNMDGHGTLSRKQATYEVITTPLQNEPDRFWGWKIFFNRDEGVASPAIVSDLNPKPSFVSYQ